MCIFKKNKDKISTAVNNAKKARIVADEKIDKIYGELEGNGKFFLISDPIIDNECKEAKT